MIVETVLIEIILNVFLAYKCIIFKRSKRR